MSNEIYVVTATPVNEKAKEQELFWNTQQISTHGNGWAVKLSESQSYKTEEKAISVRDGLLEMNEKVDEKRRTVKDISIRAVDRKEMLIARMKGL